MTGSHWFYTKKSLVLILKMMIQPLILVTLLSPHTCLNVNEEEEEEVDDIHANRNDHNEGELISIL